jgi:amidase
VCRAESHSQTQLRTPSRNPPSIAAAAVETHPYSAAVVQVDGERALAQAREADAHPAPERPLHGVPFTVKDNVGAAGLPMAIGDEERAGVVPEDDATVVASMRAAGAILLGKTNCPPYGGGIETDNPVYGRTNNPYDLERTPGGSSGGEAAAIDVWRSYGDELSAPDLYAILRRWDD